MIDKKWSEQGFIDEPIPANIDVKTEIKRMCKEKNAVIMAHYYTDAEVKDLADFVGDSRHYRCRYYRNVWRAFHGRNQQDTLSR